MNKNKQALILLVSIVGLFFVASHLIQRNECRKAANFHPAVPGFSSEYYTLSYSQKFDLKGFDFGRKFKNLEDTVSYCQGL
jgi:hypothetical protein